MKITRRDFMKVAGVVGAAAALAGCSGMAPGAETATSTAASTAASAAGSVAAATGSMELSGPIQLTFAAQEVGTAAYNYAAALQSVMLPELPAGSTIDITTTSPGGVGAPVIVNAGEECDLVMSNAGPAKWSYEKSTSEYEFGGLLLAMNLPASAPVWVAIVGSAFAIIFAKQLFGGLGQNFINIMFTQKFVDATGYKTFEEVVADKYPVKMVIKKNGSFGEQTAEKVCEALGITFDDIESWGGKVEKTGGDAIKSGLQDDLYDMTIDHIGKGQSNTTELCLTHDMYDVELNEDTRKKLCEMGYTPVTVEAGTWNKQDRDVETVGSQQCLIVDANMDAAVAYTLTKAICENKEALVTAVASLEYFDPTIAGGSGYTGCPLHPGAKAYYEEMGYDCD